MKVLCIFSGQGYQQEGLCSFFQKDNSALNYLQQLSQSMRLDFKQPELITNPYYSQLVISAYQLTLFHTIQTILIPHTLDLAGYSLGEVSAFLASSDASFDEINKVVSYRTELMTALLKGPNARTYDLLSIYGSFNIDDIQKICCDYTCYIAIINSEQRLVIGGALDNLNKLLQALAPYSIKKARFLSIHLPSHTPLYAKQKGIFKQFLKKTCTKPLRHPIISPLELCKIYNTEEEIGLLDAELYSTIPWHHMCALIKEYYYDLIIDLGPGTAMSLFLNQHLDSSEIISAADYNNSFGFSSALNQRIN